MPRVNFDGVDSPHPFGHGPGQPVPPGEYLCRVVGVEESLTRNQDAMWRVRFAIAEGPHTGRLVADNIVFSQAALPRVKLACGAFGFDTSGVVELAPEDLINLTCRLTVVVEANGGGRRNKVPYNGYAPAEG